MNSKYYENKFIKFFIPDPWNFSQPIIPSRMSYFISLAKYYATNYNNLNFIKLLLNFFKLIIFISINLDTFFKFKVIKNIILIIKTFKFDSSGLFLLNDYFSVLSYIKLKKKYNTSFNIIFLNSLAHFQHQFWTDQNSIKTKCFFYILDEIFSQLIFVKEKYLIANALTQEKINKGDYIIYRQIDPDAFLKKFNIKFKNIQQNMTNETRIYFENKSDFTKALETLNMIVFDNQKLLKINYDNKLDEIFIKINIHSKIKNKEFIFQNKVINCDDILTSIERTGSHSPKGNIITNLKLKDKTIQNHKIFELIYNFYQ